MAGRNSQFPRETIVEPSDQSARISQFVRETILPNIQNVEATYDGAIAPVGALALQPQISQAGGITPTGEPTVEELITRLWFPASLVAPVAPAFDAGWDKTSQAERHRMNDVKGASAMTAGVRHSWANAAGTTALDRQLLSNPLDGAQTVGGGTIACQLQVREFALSDNVDEIWVCLKVVSGDGLTVRGTILTFDSYSTNSEFRQAGFRNKVAILAFATNPVSAQDGDRLLLEIGYSNSTVGTSPEAQANWGEDATDLPVDESQISDGAGWIDIAGTILFQADATASEEMAGAIAPAGALILQAQLAPAGAITPEGALATGSDQLLSVSGGITPSADAIILQVELETMVGGITPSGALSTQMGDSINPTGGIMPIGTLATGPGRLLAGSTTPTGNLIKQVGLGVDGEIEPSGSPDNLHLQNVAAAGSITPTGTLLNTFAQILAGAIAPVGSLIFQVGKLLAGAITPFGVLRIAGQTQGCALTLADLRQRVYERLDDDATYYAVAEVNRALNAAQDVFAFLTLCIERQGTINLSAGEYAYRFDDHFTDFIVPLRVTTGAGARLRPETVHTLDSLDWAWRASAGTPERYASHGYYFFVIYPQPAAGGQSLKVLYAAEPQALVSDSDLCEIPAEHQPHLVDFAFWFLRLKEGGEELQNATEFLKRFAEHAAKYSEFNRARSKAQYYDREPFDLTSFDMGRLMMKLQRRRTKPNEKL